MGIIRWKTYHNAGKFAVRHTMQHLLLAQHVVRVSPVRLAEAGVRCEVCGHAREQPHTLDLRRQSACIM
jgi:hypothetical protein